MYGKRKYKRLDKQIKNFVLTDPSVPTYICGKCKKVYAINSPFAEFSLIENRKLICYAKMCGGCTELLKTWVKG